MKKAGFKDKRKNYFIKKEFQLKFILKFCLLLFLACLLICALVYFLSAKTVTTSFENMHFVVKSTADFILPLLLMSGLISVILTSLACIGVVLFISHRIAGPLYHLEKTMEEAGDGNLTVEARLRKTDEVEALATSLNNMIKKMRVSIFASQREIKELENKLNLMKSEIGKPDIPQHEANEILKSLTNKIKQLRESLFYFRAD